MSLAARLVGKGVEDAERRGAELQCEPGGSARLGVGERQCAGQKVGNGGLLSRLGFETDEQCELTYLLEWWEEESRVRIEVKNEK